MEKFIKINSLKKVFGEGEDKVHAFGPVDISINSGEFVSVLGPSGCGKSTLCFKITHLFHGELWKEILSYN